MQRSSARETGNALAASLLVYADSAELSEITLHAFESLESISPVERYHFGSWMYCRMHAHEQEHLASRESRYLDELLAPKQRAIAGYLLTPGGSPWWNERKTWFTDYFQTVVNDIVADPPPGFETSGHRTALLDPAQPQVRWAATDHPMQGSEVLTVIAEISVALAGFSGIVVALRQRGRSAKSRPLSTGTRLDAVLHDFALHAIGTGVGFSECGSRLSSRRSFTSLVRSGMQLLLRGARRAKPFPR